MTCDVFPPQGTAQGKHVPAAFAPKADGPEALKRRSSSVSPKEAAAVAAAVVSPFANGPAAARQSTAAAPQVGFRAWVGRPQSSQRSDTDAAADAAATASLRSSSGAGLKRSASDALRGAASLPPPALRSVKARTLAAAPAGALPGSGAGLSGTPSPRCGAGLSPMDRFGSAGTGTATGASDGTNFGGSGVLGGSGALGASIGMRRPSQQSSPKVQRPNPWFLAAVCDSSFCRSLLHAAGPWAGLGRLHSAGFEADVGPIDSPHCSTVHQVHYALSTGPVVLRRLRRCRPGVPPPPSCPLQRLCPCGLRAQQHPWSRSSSSGRSSRLRSRRQRSRRRPPSCCSGRAAWAMAPPPPQRGILLRPSSRCRLRRHSSNSRHSSSRRSSKCSRCERPMALVSLRSNCLLTCSCQF